MYCANFYKISLSRSQCLVCRNDNRVGHVNKSDQWPPLVGGSNILLFIYATKLDHPSIGEMANEYWRRFQPLLGRNGEFCAIVCVPYDQERWRNIRRLKALV